jgi:hypothetical protein
MLKKNYGATKGMSIEFTVLANSTWQKGVRGEKQQQQGSKFCSYVRVMSMRVRICVNRCRCF